jgi:hypothetical protein
VIDLVPDELTLARSQIDAGQPGLAEGTVRRRLAWLESEGVGLTDESDALRVLLAEALWRQQRPDRRAAGAGCGPLEQPAAPPPDRDGGGGRWPGRGR